MTQEETNTNPYNDFQQSPEERQRNAAEEQALEEAGKHSGGKNDSVKKIVEAFTSDDEEPHINWSLPAILGGDILSAKWFRKHALLIIFIIILTILYITNRYASQQETIQIENLKEKLKDKRYDALTRSSLLLQRCRQSEITNYLKSKGDSTLQVSSEPPYEICLK